MGKRLRGSGIAGSVLVLTGVGAIVFLLDRGAASWNSAEGGSLPPRSFSGTVMEVPASRVVDGFSTDPNREDGVEPLDSRLQKQLAWIGAVENPGDAERRLRNLVLDGRVSAIRLARLVGARDRVSDRVAAAIHAVLAPAAEVDEVLSAILIASFRARTADRPRTEAEWAAVVDGLNDRAYMGSALDALPADWVDRQEVLERVVEIASGYDSDYLRVKAVQQLAAAGRGESATLLRRIAQEATSLEVEAAAIRGLIGDSDPDTLDVLREVLMGSTNYGPTTRFAVRALGEFAESREATSLLMAAYRETVDPWVRLAAVRSLASHAVNNAEARRFLSNALGEKK